MSITISAEQARRFLIRRQKFTAYGSPFAGPEGVAQALRHLEAVQIDPLCPFERNHHQVLYNRVHGYQPAWLEHMVYQEKQAFEYYCNALCVLPIEDYPYFRRAMEQQRELTGAKIDPSVRQTMQQILRHIEERGQAGSSDFNSGQKISGWWDDEPRTKIEKLAFDYLHLIGNLVITRRADNQRSRSYNVPERFIPSYLLGQEIDQVAWERFAMLKFLRAYGLSQLSISRFGWYSAPKAAKNRLLLELIDQGEVVPVQVEGVKRTYYCLADLMPELSQAFPLPEGEAAVILGPLDNLLWDRERLEDFWKFYYRWEVYVPKAKRQYGYYVVPVLYGEWLVGRIEMRADKEQNLLRVDNLWFEPGREDALPAVRRAVVLQAEYLGLGGIRGI